MIESGYIIETVNDAALVTFQRSLEIAVMVTGQSINKSLNLFSACPPRPTNVAGDNYAADMDNTLKNQFADIESARQFFQTTYPTDGLKDVSRKIYHRLMDGDDSTEDSIYRLDSRFGGGKTHTLITLAGAALYPELVREGATPVPAEYAPSQAIRLVAFTGENTDLEQGANLGEGYSGIRPKSLIGHIAAKIGGESAFRQFKVHDDNLTSPGSGDIAELLGDAPCLILIDEFVQMLSRYEDERFSDKLPHVRTLFGSLIHAITSRPYSVLVISTPDPAADAFRKASQQMLDVLTETDAVISRTSFETTSSSADGRDLPRILQRRLFASIDEDTRRKVSRSYADLLQRSTVPVAPVPPNITAQQWFWESYPFHPDTLSVITDRLAANENFQNTRGTLRLLAKTIRRMQEDGRYHYEQLIHPHHIDPADDEISGELIGRLQKDDFKSAIQADITGDDSTAKRINEGRPARAGERIANTVLLSSLAPTDQARGFSTAQLMRATLSPFDEDPSVLANAIEGFRSLALYVNDDPNDPMIYFTTNPSLNRILRDQSNSIGLGEVADHIRGAITSCFTESSRNVSQLEVSIFPEAPNIPDNPDAINLGVLWYEWMPEGRKNLNTVLTNFYRNSPLNNGQTPRQYKNNVAILVPDDSSSGEMEAHARHYLAAEQVKQSQSNRLLDYQKESLDKELASAKRNLFIAIQKLYVNLYCASRDDTISRDALLTRIRITPDDATEQPGNGQHAVKKAMESQRLIVEGRQANLSADMYWDKRANLRSGKMSLVALKEEFARQPGNYKLLDKSVALGLFQNALNTKALVIELGSGYRITRGESLVNIDDPKAMVYLAKNACDRCNAYEPECGCDTGPDEDLCEECGKALHPGACEELPATPETPVAPDFNSGYNIQALNVLGQDLRRHMLDNGLTETDIDNVVVRGASAEFLTFMSSLLGQNIDASVSYQLRREGDIRLEVANVAISEWNRDIGRLAPRLEGIKGVEVQDASLEISHSETSPEQFGQVISQLPTQHSGTLVVTFKQPESTRLF